MALPSAAGSFPGSWKDRGTFYQHYQTSSTASKLRTDTRTDCRVDPETGENCEPSTYKSQGVDFSLKELIDCIPTEVLTVSINVTHRQLSAAEVTAGVEGITEQDIKDALDLFFYPWCDWP